MCGCLGARSGEWLVQVKGLLQGEMEDCVFYVQRLRHTLAKSTEEEKGHQDLTRTGYLKAR